MVGTTKPFGVAIATPILCKPMILSRISMIMICSIGTLENYIAV